MFISLYIIVLQNSVWKSRERGLNPFVSIERTQTGKSRFGPHSFTPNYVILTNHSIFWLWGYKTHIIFIKRFCQNRSRWKKNSYWSILHLRSAFLAETVELTSFIWERGWLSGICSSSYCEQGFDRWDSLSRGLGFSTTFTLDKHRDCYLSRKRNLLVTQGL